MSATIVVRDVDKRYVGRGRETLAMQRVSLDVAQGEFVAFVGPSGCGKSTLLNMVAGVVEPSSGTILHDGRTVAGFNTNVGYMTQTDSVLPWRTVEDNVGLPLEFRGVPVAERKERIERILGVVNLKGFNKAFPKELSGGMRKRVALAQMLVYEPKTLLMDEPFGALDAQLKLVMQAQLLRIWQETGKTIVFVTHDLAEAIAVASRVVVFSGRPGRIKHVEQITIPYPRDVFKVRFLPAFEQAYERLWRELAPEIESGEDL